MKYYYGWDPYALDDLGLPMYQTHNPDFTRKMADPAKGLPVLSKLKTVATVVGTVQLVKAGYEVSKIFKSTSVKK